MLVGPFGLGICQWWAHAGCAAGSAANAFTAAAAGCLGATGCAGSSFAAVATTLGGCTAGEARRAVRGLVRIARGACSGLRVDDTCRATGRRAGAEPFDAGFLAPLLDAALPATGCLEVAVLEGRCAGFRAVALAGFETTAVFRSACFGAERLAIVAAGPFAAPFLAVDTLAGRDCAACDPRVDFDAFAP